jgi:hypothetical protein
VGDSQEPQECTGSSKIYSSAAWIQWGSGVDAQLSRQDEALHHWDKA